MNDNIVILRVRRGVPGIGRKMSRYFNANEVTCGFRPKRKIRDGALVINYGRSEWPVWFLEAKERGVRLLNSPSAVGICVDKLKTLHVLDSNGVRCLDFTDDANWANDVWLGEGHSVIARSVLTGKQGKGVSLYNPNTMTLENDGINFREFDFSAPLYTKFYDKTHEFRVHVVNGQVIDLVQKKRLGSKKRAERGIEVDDLVRNHKKGWVFAHKDLICDTGGGREEISSLAIAACRAIGIDFAGVDLLAKYDEDGRFLDAVVCEVNSAPGMSSPTTFQRYMKAFEALL